MESNSKVIIADCVLIRIYRSCYAQASNLW